MVSSMGYVILSGKMQLDRHDTTLVTPVSWAVCSTLSLILRLSLCEGVKLSLTGHAVKKQRRYFHSCKTAVAVNHPCTPALSHQKEQVVPHVFIESPDFCSEVDDMSWVVLLEHSFGLPEISVHICLNLVVKTVKTYIL